MSQSLDKIVEDLKKHQIIDESFQDAQKIHNLEMKKAQLQTTESMARIEKKIDAWLNVASSFSVSGKIVLKFLGVIVAVATGIAAIKYIVTGILFNLFK